MEVEVEVEVEVQRKAKTPVRSNLQAKRVRTLAAWKSWQLGNSER